MSNLFIVNNGKTPICINFGESIKSLEIGEAYELTEVELCAFMKIKQASNLLDDVIITNSATPVPQAEVVKETVVEATIEDTKDAVDAAHVDAPEAPVEETETVVEATIEDTKDVPVEDVKDAPVEDAKDAPVVDAPAEDVPVVDAPAEDVKETKRAKRAKKAQ